MKRFLVTEKLRSGRKRRLWLFYGLLFVIVALLAGCGGGSNGRQIQPQNYIVTITATSGTIQHPAQVTVTVQWVPFGQLC